MYEYNTAIRMQHTDAYGVVFFASVFVLAHECYESFFERTVSLATKHLIWEVVKTRKMLIVK